MRLYAVRLTHSNDELQLFYGQAYKFQTKMRTKKKINNFHLAELKKKKC